MREFIKTKYNLNDNELISAVDELPLWSAPFGIRLLEKINYKKNFIALDIGSGLGFPLLEVAMRLGNSCKVYGIDPWEVAVERIKKKIKLYGITNVEILAGVAENIPLPDNSIDLIISNNGLNNVNDLTAVIKECSRISKIGSQFLFTFNTDKTMLEFYSEFEKLLLEENMLKEIQLMKEHIYKKRRPEEEYVELLNENGYAVNEICRDQFEYKFVDGSAMLNHFLITLSFIESWKALVPEERQWEIFEELENRLNEKSRLSGSLILTVPFVLIDSEKTRV